MHDKVTVGKPTFFLPQVWKEFAAGLDERSSVLALSVMFHQKAEQVWLDLLHLPYSLPVIPVLFTPFCTLMEGHFFIFLFLHQTKSCHMVEFTFPAQKTLW